MMIWGGKGCEERHGMAMNGTMEEDRRLRNKARRERILMMGARQAAKEAKEKEVAGGGKEKSVSPSSPTNAEFGPIRNQRTSHTVSPY